MNVSESQLLYLVTILQLKKQKKIVQHIDIAIALGYSKPSVTHAVQQLGKHGYLIIHDRSISLSETGFQIANQAADRYEQIYQLLCTYGFPAFEAGIYAKKLIHVMDDEFIWKLAAFHQEQAAKKLTSSK